MRWALKSWSRRTRTDDKFPGRHDMSSGDNNLTDKGAQIDFESWRVDSEEFNESRVAV